LQRRDKIMPICPKCHMRVKKSHFRHHVRTCHPEGSKAYQHYLKSIEKVWHVYLADHAKKSGFSSVKQYIKWLKKQGLPIPEVRGKE